MRGNLQDQSGFRAKHAASRERIATLAAEFRRASEWRVEVQRLERKVRVKRHVSEQGAAAAHRSLMNARRELATTQSAARSSVPQLFSQEQSELPGDVPAKRQVGPEHHTVELQAQADGFARLVIRDLGTIDLLDIRCKPKDANLVAFLVTSLPSLLRSAHEADHAP